MDLAQVNSYFEAPAEIRNKKMLAFARSKRQKFDSVDTMEKIGQEQKIYLLLNQCRKTSRAKVANGEGSQG